MDVSTTSPAYTLHALVTHLDRGADSILRERFGVSYPRYLALLTTSRLDGGTQKSLADELGMSEPSVSRTLSGLTRDGLVTVVRVPGEGNRRRVHLTDEGRRILVRCTDVLDEAFARVMEAAGVTGEQVVGLAGRMLSVIHPPTTDGVTP